MTCAALVVVLTTIACLPASASRTAEAPEIPCAITAPPASSITVWHALDGPRAERLQALARDFEVSSGMHVDLVKVAGGDFMIDRWRKTAPRLRPDLALVPQDSLELLSDSGTVRPIDACLDEASGPDILPVIRSSYTIDDHVVALPVAVSTPVLVVNHAAFAAAGLDASMPPATPEAIRQTSEQLVDAGVTDYGIAIDTGPQSGGSWFVEQWLAQRGVLSVTPSNGHDGVADEVTWGEGPSVDSLTWLASLVHDELAVNVGRNSGGSDDLLRLGAAEGSAAMAIHTSAALGEMLDLQDSGQKPGVDIGVGPLPGPGHGGLVGGSGLVFSSSTSLRRAAAAWKFGAFFASPSTQAQWASASGYLPASADSVELEPLRTTYVVRPQMAVAYEQLLSIPGDPAHAGPAAGPERSIREQLAGATTRVLAGMDPGRALHAAARASNLLLADYRRSTTHDR